jgi:signal transduction histidine kinase
MFDSVGYFLANLFDTSDFPARWYCGDWTPLHGWVHIVSDSLIGLAYFTIPATIVYFVLSRRDIPFPRIFWLFGAFIVACGTTHLIEAAIFWEPVYRLSALAKMSTASVSLVTAGMLVRVMPHVLHLPGIEAVNRRLQSANAELSDFADIVSHDLKAPLRGARRLTEWLETDEGQDPESRAENLRLLRDRIDRMDALISGIRLYSKTGRTGYEPTELNLREVLNDVLNSYSPETRQRIELRGSAPRYFGDAIQMYQVLQNLLENALQFGKPDGTVIVSLADAGGLLRIRIQDDGPGIAPEMADRVFRPFFSSRSTEHTGIGLSIVKRIVDAAGGRIWFESQPEYGTSFYVTLPNVRMR